MYYLDTCMCIDFLHGRLPGFRERLETSDPKLFGVPAIVQAELLSSAEYSASPGENRLKVETFLLPFAIVPFDSSCAVEYAHIQSELDRKGQPIGPNDMLIAATAVANGAYLVTHNVREFKQVRGLKLIDWTEFPLGSRR